MTRNGGADRETRAERLAEVSLGEIESYLAQADDRRAIPGTFWNGDDTRSIDDPALVDAYIVDHDWEGFLEGRTAAPSP